jgi:AmiR/NasT family two-component response regulator
MSKLAELIKQSYQRIDEIKTAELAKVRIENERLQWLLEKRSKGMETIQRIAEAGGLLMSDRDDIEATYRRRR